MSETINTFWTLQQANPGVTVRSVYLTTSTVGREEGLWIPSERGGLEYWREAVSPESDLRPLRAVLDTLSLHSELRAWVRAATDAQVRESNCWHESNGSMERRTSANAQKTLGRAVARRCEHYGLLPSES